MPSFSVGDFRLDQLSVEFKYAPAYELWDRSGQLWSSIAEKLGPIKAETVRPSNTTFLARNRYKLAAELERSYIIDFQPNRNFDDDCTDYVSFFDEIIINLHLTALTKVGVRARYSKSFRDERDALDQILLLKLTPIPQEKLFGIEPIITKPQYHVEVSDDDFLYIAKLYTTTRKTELSPPPELQAKLQAEIQEFNSKIATVYEFEIDLDFQTKKTIDIASFRLKDHLHMWRRGLNRDLEKLINMALS